MREFYRRHRGLHRWLLAVAALLAVYFALRPVPGLMNWLSRRIIMPWERAVASVCYLFRTSIAEVLYIVLLSVSVFYVANVLRRMVTQPHRGRTLYRFFLTVVCSGLSIYAGFCLLWGVNYYADSFQQQSGIYARSCTVEELEAVTADFAHQLAQAADNVQRDENGCFAVSRQEIFAAATSVYAPSYEEFPCLADEGSHAQGHQLLHSAQRHGLHGLLLPLHRGGQPQCGLPRQLSALHHRP